MKKIPTKTRVLLIHSVACLPNITEELMWTTRGIRTVAVFVTIHTAAIMLKSWAFQARILVGLRRRWSLGMTPVTSKWAQVGKGLPCQVPSWEAFPHHLRLCREEKTKERIKRNANYSFWLGFPIPTAWSGKSQTEWPKEPPDWQPSPCLNQDTSQLGRGTDLSWKKKNSIAELPAWADFPLMEDGNNKTKDRFLPSRNSLITAAETQNLRQTFHCFPTVWKYRKKENLAITPSSPLSLCLSSVLSHSTRSNIFCRTNKWLAMNLLVPGSEEGDRQSKEPAWETTGNCKVAKKTEAPDRQPSQR